ncbi:MAG: prepilin-type N-terminal cleavage/methylation domain-containing protein [Phycisphaerales bacterium]|nr:prepilin-type N-terminal cleavage/methylation domain-containing protein [Phycisphaerales bacterium]
MTTLRRRAAFTLIELLVVIAIIGVIVSILLPALSSARETAKLGKCLSNGKQTLMSMTMYANQYNDWLPVFTRPAGASRSFLDGQARFGGVAGLFSLNQIGDGTSYGYTGFPPLQGRGRYDDSNTMPLMAPFIDGYANLVCPSDTLDIYYGTVTPEAGAPPYSPDRERTPVAPGGESQVVSYNISYIYIAGLRTDEPEIVEPAPIWGDETLGPDVSVQAWYRNGREGDRAQWDVEPGYYSKFDNHGERGANWIFTDGHGEQFKGLIHDIFYNPNPEPGNTRSINSINRRRSDKVQTID